MQQLIQALEEVQQYHDVRDRRILEILLSDTHFFDCRSRRTSQKQVLVRRISS